MLFRLFIWLWTLFGWTWILYDSIKKPENWYNFTSWTWFLQTVFYSLFLFISSKHDTVNNWLKMTTTDHYVFLDAYMLPIVWACEYTAAVGVVYMMVDESGAIEASLDRNGPVMTWVGNFLIHYMTVIVLLVYMHKDPIRIFTCTRNAREEASGRTVHLTIVLFTLIYAYAMFFPPASHYGIAGMTDTVTALLLVAVSASGLAVFHNWSLG